MVHFIYLFIYLLFTSSLHRWWCTLLYATSNIFILVESVYQVECEWLCFFTLSEKAASVCSLASPSRWSVWTDKFTSVQLRPVSNAAFSNHPALCLRSTVSFVGSGGSPKELCCCIKRLQAPHNFTMEVVFPTGKMSLISAALALLAIASCPSPGKLISSV